MREDLDLALLAGRVERLDGLTEDLARRIDIDAERETAEDRGAADILVGAHRDRVLEQHRVGQDDPLTVGLAQVCVPRCDLLDKALDLRALDAVAQPERLAVEDQHAGQEVLEDIAEGEADRDRAKAEAGHDIGRGDRREGDGSGDGGFQGRIDCLYAPTVGRCMG
jgi:hypothetical protein